MVLDLAALPNDANALRAIVVAQAAALADKDAALAIRDAELVAHRLLVDKLRLQLARLRRMQFGRRSRPARADAGGVGG